ncbi:MAG: iron-containing redox enzyme family protein [Myxococcota bacterium]|nr:iron-containing redox enzyme family protein [Myxococcota bacterium]MEE2780505.1 iron-containing redox enzyme family protein [Myxococcota bacterium]
MGIREHIERVYQAQVDGFSSDPQFLALASGEAAREDYDRFIGNVFRTHQNSPQYLAFLYALSPPESRERVEHNMLEELGLEEEHGDSHPELLIALLKGSGLSDQMSHLTALASEMMRQSLMIPLPFPTWRQVGLAVMVEVFSFEYCLARVSTPIANALASHRGLDEDTLIWFRHHSEVDIQHAEEALDTLVDYVQYYEFSEAEAAGLIDAVMADNVMLKRYFAPLELGGG